MTQKMIEELLELITLWLDDIRDIKANSYHIDELLRQLEQKANDIGPNIVGLEENAQDIDEKLAQISNCVVSSKQKSMIRRAMN
ncbi:hypothetical protein [Oceanobacillus halophilus]|uniref:Uncharacterized protein n=1 Tax=Oceanobacillus halophilus TaxID=930130 RepID=A0A495A7K9_9BACI|nr:hypothetical protein [Oceanobacillus halophilus]RKQ35604.1 hypothetical protein D8M06_04855 [Oceanobacillus halophilus]